MCQLEACYLVILVPKIENLRISCMGRKYYLNNVSVQRKFTVLNNTHVQCKPINFFFSLFITKIFNSAKASLKSVMIDKFGKYPLWILTQGHLQGQRCQVVSMLYLSCASKCERVACAFALLSQHRSNYNF